MTRKLALLAASLAVMASAACDGSGGGAKIKSFTANPAILPTLGGETTLVWNVKGEESLEITPDIGAVTGSSLTLTITENTTFTLIARRDGRSTRRKATVTLAPPGSVVGIVRTNPGREVLPDVAVFCNGQATVTDQNGAFLFEDVPTPYEISLFSPQDAFAMIWEGLTRFDPILEIPSSFGNSESVNISGTASPADAGVNTTTNVFLKNDREVFPGGTTADGATGVYGSSTGWQALAPDPTDGTAIAVRYDTDGITGAVTFTDFGRSDFTADPLGPALTGINVALSAVQNSVATGQLLVDPEESLGFGVPTMILDSATGAAADVGFLLPTGALVVTTANAFTLAMPDVPGSALFWQSYDEPAINAFGYRAIRFSPGAQNIQVDFPQLPRLLTPVEDGTIDRETLFQMASLPSSVKMWAFNDFSGPGIQVLVITTRDRMPLPDLEEAGIRFPDGALIGWGLIEISPQLSTDDAAGPDGLFGAAPEHFGFSVTRQVILDAP